MAKVKLNLSLEPDTKERLEDYAAEKHTTISQLITDWIWSQKVKGGQIKGQISITDKKNR